MKKSEHPDAAETKHFWSKLRGRDKITTEDMMNELKKN